MSLKVGVAPCLGILLVLLLVRVGLPAQRESRADPRFPKMLQELRDLAQRTPFGVPIRMYSEERSDEVHAEVQAILENPFEAVKAALASPAAWCEFVPLNVTIKACVFRSQPHETPLTFYVGPKRYQAPEDALSQPYRFTVQARGPGVLSVSLSAESGLYGTTAHRMELEAASVEGKTVIALNTSYVQSAASKLATAIYLSTVGRNKVGFSREDAQPGARGDYVKGMRGMVERNVMRYYLALEALLDTQAISAPHRFEARLNMAYELMERYPLQLHDLEKAEYLDTKRREREDQLRLQRQLDAAGPRPAPR
jgi:hypothetical protein